MIEKIFTNYVDNSQKRIKVTNQVDYSEKCIRSKRFQLLECCIIIHMIPCNSTMNINYN